MSRDHARWGTEQFRSEQLKLAVGVSNRSIRGYPGDRRPRPSSQSWCTFLANHAAQMWAADLATYR